MTVPATRSNALLYCTSVLHVSTCSPAGFDCPHSPHLQILSVGGDDCLVKPEVAGGATGVTLGALRLSCQPANTGGGALPVDLINSRIDANSKASSVQPTTSSVAFTALAAALSLGLRWRREA